MEKSKFNQIVGERLRSAMEQMGWTQQKILAEAAQRGYNLAQASLSKLLSGSNMQTLQIVQVCAVMHLNIAEILSLDPEATVHLPEKQVKKSASIIVSDARDPKLRGYLGEYSIYFYTTKNENFIHNGTFKLLEEPTTHQFMADFRFKTEEKDELGIDIEKHYFGPAFYSSSMQTIYCELCSEEIGEKGYFLFHYDYLAYQNLKSRLITAITVSSGIKRLPAMQKLLITRDPLEKEDIDYLCGHLKLNNSEVLISENAYREFLRDPHLPKKFFEYFGEQEHQAERFIDSAAKVPYYTFNESLISDSFLPLEDKIKIICLLRKYSAAARYNKISIKAEEIIFNYLKCKEENPKKETGKAENRKAAKNGNSAG